MPIPNPEPGLVISHAYLWHHEYQAGWEEGQKDRPSVIVLAIEREADGATIVTVLPITHSAPADPISAIEIPLPVKRHLGLDDDRSWIVVDEGNEFLRTLWMGVNSRLVDCFGIPTLGQKLLLAPQWSRWSVRALLSDLTHAVGAVIHHL